MLSDSQMLFALVLSDFWLCAGSECCWRTMWRKWKARCYPQAPDTSSYIVLLACQQFHSGISGFEGRDCTLKAPVWLLKTVLHELSTFEGISHLPHCLLKAPQTVFPLGPWFSKHLQHFSLVFWSWHSLQQFETMKAACLLQPCPVCMWAWSRKTWPCWGGPTSKYVSAAVWAHNVLSLAIFNWVSMKGHFLHCILYFLGM